MFARTFKKLFGVIKKPPSTTTTIDNDNDDPPERTPTRKPLPGAWPKYNPPFPFTPTTTPTTTTTPTITTPHKYSVPGPIAKMSTTFTPAPYTPEWWLPALPAAAAAKPPDRRMAEISFAERMRTASRAAAEQEPAQAEIVKPVVGMSRAERDARWERRRARRDRREERVLRENCISYDMERWGGVGYS